MSDEQATLSRRSVLRSSAVAAGGLTTGAAVTGGATGIANESAATSGKRGGRGHVDGTADRNRPFTLRLEGTDSRDASCMAEESAEQVYLTYSIQYCDSDDDEDATFYVLPDEAELVETETYVIRSIRPCRASDLEQVAFGPAREDC